MQQHSVDTIVTLAWLALTCCSGPALAAEEAPPLRGLSLQAAIAELETSGLTIYYSSDLIRRGMRVDAEPPAGTSRELLAAILTPFALTIEPGPGDSVLIVRRPKPIEPSVTARTAAVTASAPSNEQRPIEEIVVAASQYELLGAAAASAVRLSASDIEFLPDLGDDALRAVHRLPGTATNGLSARANIRGGEAGEALVLFDGLRLYDPYHLDDFQSVFSTIDPRVVRTIDVYTGGFPALFGDRMSSVIDVASMRPPEDRYTELAVSFFNTSALTAGRFDDGNGEWLASFRRSNLDLLYDAFSAKPERPRYVDALGRLSYRLNEAVAITLSTLYFRDDVALNDDLDIEEHAAAANEDRYLWARFDHTLGKTLRGATLVAQTTLARDRTGISDREGITAGSLEDHRLFSIDSLQSDWSWNAGDTLLLQFGATLSRSRGSYDYRDEVEFDVTVDAPGALHRAASTTRSTAASATVHSRACPPILACAGTSRHWTPATGGRSAHAWVSATSSAPVRP
jgi:hypothetical protein